MINEGARLSSIPASRGTVIRACCEPDISQQLQLGAAFSLILTPITKAGTP